MPVLEFGYVRGRFRLVTGSVETPAVGTVKFTPVEPDEILVTDPLSETVTRQKVDASFDGDGDLRQVGTLADTIKLAVGRWLVDFSRVQGLTLKPFYFDVTVEDTEESPADLSLLIPIVPTPAQRLVVNEQLYLDTVAAKEDAEEAAASVAPGVPGGTAQLDGSGKVPSGQVPVQAIADDPVLTANYVVVRTADGHPLAPDTYVVITLDKTLAEITANPVADIDDITFQEA
jgi:hypothetical protein